MNFFIKTLGIGLIMAMIVPQAEAQPCKRKIIKQLKKDIGYLASDELGGRRTGTDGEKKAATYIAAYYKSIGIGGYNSEYLHPFDFVYGKSLGTHNKFSIDGQTLNCPSDFIPLSFSSNKSLEAELIPEVTEKDNVWFVPMYTEKDQAENPHFDWEKDLFDRAQDARKEGATALVVYGNYPSKNEPSFQELGGFETLNIPCVYLKHSSYDRIKNSIDSSITVHVQTDVKSKPRSGQNIISVINNNAPYTVIIGAHYDHLGHGEDGNSRATGSDDIHNGADDNASGTAAVMQLAKWLKKDNNPKYNYMFIHFSGEELGLIGSKAAVKSFGLDSSKIAFMINLDMVGRMVDSTKGLTIGGVGTSPSWANVVLEAGEKFKVSIDSAGIGPSDHSSFYQAGVPVLFFFTGLHTDYHKPSDDADRINYKGEMQIMKFIYKTINEVAEGEKPIFKRTKQPNIGRTRFKVTLGIMPDYTYNQSGVKVDGVIDARPAKMAGILAGDVIKKIGTVEVMGMQTYMEALGEYEKGMTVDVEIDRAGQKMILPLTF